MSYINSRFTLLYLLYFKHEMHLPLLSVHKETHKVDINRKQIHILRQTSIEPETPSFFTTRNVKQKE